MFRSSSSSSGERQPLSCRPVFERTTCSRVNCGRKSCANPPNLHSKAGAEPASASSRRAVAAKPIAEANFHHPIARPWGSGTDIHSPGVAQPRGPSESGSPTSRRTGPGYMPTRARAPGRPGWPPQCGPRARQNDAQHLLDGRFVVVGEHQRSGDCRGRPLASSRRCACAT
jgi:hypothetical protein